jgi:hypothetical protein
VPTRRPKDIQLEPGEQRKLGSHLFNFVWTLLEKEQRTERETDRMIDAAHASRLFWENVGGPVDARGEWQISRAYASGGQADNARHHAQRCLELCESAGVGGFDLAYAYEALARAAALSGDSDAVSLYSARAQEVAAEVAEREDRELILTDLKTLAD